MFGLERKSPLEAAGVEPFRHAYESCYRPLRRYVARLLGDAEAADDVTQEAFLRLWRELRAGRSIEHPRAWLYLVASREVITRFRSRRRADRVLALADAAEVASVPSRLDLEADTGRRELVQRALDALGEPMRQCILLYHAGLTGREIAEVLGVKPSYVGTLVVRGHERFRRECEALGIRDPVRRS